MKKQLKNHKNMFPVFMDLNYKNILVIGGGRIAARRIRILLDFGCSITVISPDLSETARQFLRVICWRQRQYQKGDCRGAYLVLAATDDRDVNRAVAKECARLQILVSVADQNEESTFFFPAIIQNESLTVGVVSKTCNHRLVKQSAKLIRDQITVTGEDEY